jgi:hypothetical protein
MASKAGQCTAVMQQLVTSLQGAANVPLPVSAFFLRPISTSAMMLFNSQA